MQCMCLCIGTVSTVCPVTVINEFVFKVGVAIREVRWWGGGGFTEIGLPC